MPTEPLIWRSLQMTVPLTVTDVVAVVRRLATLTGDPRVVVETHGTGGRASWQLGVPATTLLSVEHLLDAHLKETQLGEASLRGVPTLVAAVRLRSNLTRRLRIEHIESVSRALLSALAATSRSETLSLQLVLGDRHRPRQPRHNEQQPAEQRRDARDKLSEHGFSLELRLAAVASTEGRARALVSSLAAALRGLEAPGLSIALKRSSTAAFMEARAPWFWPLRLSVSELACVLAWPVGPLPLPGVASPHPRRLPVAERVPRAGRILGDALVSQRTRPVALSVRDSLRHLHVLGPTGVGKSTMLAQLALSDLEAGRGLVVVDPKGDLVSDLLTRIPASRRDDVVVLDAADQMPIGLNPLTGSDPDLAADTTLGVLHSLYRESWGPRTQDILHACLLSLARRGDASLIMVPLLLSNPGFRRSVVGPVVKRDPLGLGSFWAWFESISDAERQAAIAPLMNKLRPVLLRPGLRAVFGQRQPRFNVSDVFTKRRVMLVSLAKGSLGPDGATLLGSVLVGMLWQAALGRVAVDAGKRHPVMIMVDEVQDYLRLPAGDLGDALAQARGLGVGFTLAHQHLGQLPRELRAGVLANARSRVCFQLAHDDAVVMARGTQLQPEDFTALPAFHAYTSLLIDGTPSGWGSLVTRPLPPDVTRPDDLRARSRQRYGRALSEVEADWAELAAHPADERLGRTRRAAGDAS